MNHGIVMTAIRNSLFAIIAGTITLASIAAEPPIVQVAAELELGARELPMVDHNGASHGWLLTDDSIDSITLSRPIAGFEPKDARSFDALSGVEVLADCQCNDKPCRGVCRDPGHPRKPRISKPGDRDRGDCPPLRYRMDDCRRAGNPHCYHRWAKCGVDEKYSAWFVGGGTPFCFGRPRTSNEGTWGLDYGGLFGRTKVWLNYTRGRNQGGEGAYRTDGEPKIISRAHKLLHLGHK